MTNEMTVQQQRPSALPYVGIGAAAGGLGAYFGAPKIEAVNNWMTKDQKAICTVADLVKEYTDQDKFESSKFYTEADESTQKALKDAKGTVDEALKGVDDVFKKENWQDDVKKVLGDKAKDKSDDELKNLYKNHLKEEAANKFKNLTEPKAKGWKTALVVGGVALLGSALAMLFRPKSKEV